MDHGLSSMNANVNTDSFLDNLLPRLAGDEVTWDAPSLNHILHDEIAKLQVKSKPAMTVGRRALTGMKVRSCYIQATIVLMRIQ